MEVVYEQFTTLPETRICLAASFDVYANVDYMNLQYLRGTISAYEYAMAKEKPQHRVGKYGGLLLNATSFPNFIGAMMAGAYVVDFNTDSYYHSGRAASLFGVVTSKPELQFTSNDPLVCFVFRSNGTMRADVMRLHANLHVSCSWTTKAYSVNRETYNFKITQMGKTPQNSLYVKTTSSKSSGFSASVRYARTKRMGQCLHQDVYEEEDTCIVKYFKRYFKCCPCFNLHRLCNESDTCCVPKHLPKNMSDSVHTVCKTRKELKFERPCDAFQTIWTAKPLPDAYFPRGCRDGERENTVRFEIEMNREYPCYTERYAVTMENVFSSIGGTLGLFLGGSIISLIQCGVISYRQLSSTIRKVRKWLGRKKTMASSPVKRELKKKQVWIVA